MATAAAAATVHPLPPPPARREVEFTNLVWAAVNVVICLFLACVWVFCWSLAIMEIERLVCSWDFAVATGGYKIAYAAGVTILLVLPIIFLLDRRVARVRAVNEARTFRASPTPTATDIEATREPALKKIFAAIWDRLPYALRERDPITLAFLASVAFLLLVPSGYVVMSTSRMWSRRFMMGVAIYNVGETGMNAVNCFVLCPLVTVRVWMIRIELGLGETAL